MCACERESFSVGLSVFPSTIYYTCGVQCGVSLWPVLNVCVAVPLCQCHPYLFSPSLPLPLPPSLSLSLPLPPSLSLPPSPSLSPSPSLPSMVFTASTDKTGAVWDCSAGQRIKKLKGHTSFVNSCASSRRGTQLVATGSDDGTMKVHMYIMLGAKVRIHTILGFHFAPM